MSKAFIPNDAENDDEADEDAAPKLPTGSKNYMTPSGAARLQAELHHLLHKDRPEVTAVVAWAAGNGDRSENADYIYGKRRLREIDRRIRFLTKRLEAAEIIDPATVNSDQVFFGATVTIQDEAGQAKSYAIVGVDEADPGNGRISWISPLAASLLKGRVGDLVSWKSPKGVREVEILEIKYLAIA